MNKKDALIQTKEAIRVEYQAAHDAISEIFEPVRRSFMEADTELEIYARNSWNREINGRIVNKVLGWSSEQMRFDLVPVKDGSFELKFNYGSGGWNDGIDSQRILMYKADICRATCLAQNIANDSRVSLSVAMDKFFEIQETLHSIGADINKIEEAEKKAEADEKRREVMKQLPFEAAKSGKFYMENLPEQDMYKEVRLAYVGFTGEGELRFHKKEISAEKYTKTVFKVDGSRSSRRELENMDLSDYIVIPRDMWYQGVISHYGSMTVEQVLENVAEFNKRKEEEAV